MRLEDCFWPAAGVLLVVMAGVQLTSALQENQTLDEGTHLVSGYSYWVKRDYRLSPEHPPLAKMLCALPLLAMRPEFPNRRELWDRADAFVLGREFLYRNRILPETLLLAGRVVTMVLSLGLGLILALWMRREFSSMAALFALALYTFDPNIIAHGRYVTTDLPVTLLFFASCLSWHGYLTSGKPWALYRTGVLAALALATKFSALLLAPAFAFLYLTRRIKLPRRHTVLALCVVPFVVIWATYRFDTRSISEDPVLQGKANDARLVQNLPVPGYYWFRGIHLLLRYNHSRPTTYLLGNLEKGGSWLYFPVVFAVKTPVATLLILALAAFCARRLVLKYPVLIVPPAVYFLASMLSSINIGVRHLLPIYPFLFALAGAALFHAQRDRAVRGAAVGLAGLLVLTSAAAYPHYLPFFNVAAGGPDSGPRYLLDSNLDWGQDLVNLRPWAETSGQPSPRLIAYFGGAEPFYFGFPYDPPSTRDTNDVVKLKGMVAISAQYLFGFKDERYAWLRKNKPVTRIGYSIYVYDLGAGSDLALDRASRAPEPQ
jgi:hypothetical protein